MKKYIVSAKIKVTEIHYADNEKEAIEFFSYEHEDDVIDSTTIEVKEDDTEE